MAAMLVAVPMFFPEKLMTRLLTKLRQLRRLILRFRCLLSSLRCGPRLLLCLRHQS